MSRLVVFLGSFVSLCALTVQAWAFDNEQALKSFKKCSSCHMIGPEAKRRAGPELNGLDGRPIGANEYYKYSPAFRDANSEGKIWDSETLDKFLEKPKAFLKGTRMSFAGISDPAERLNLVEWLLHFDIDGNELSAKASVDGANTNLLGASASSLEGDPEYGQYLAGECTTCHRANGADEGIPGIIGWQKQDFIHALYLYKTDARENPVMRTVAKRLADEEMAALAAYFGSLKTE